MKCGHGACRCTTDGEEFCSEQCRTQSSGEMAGESCDCGHRMCTGEDVPLA